MPQNNAAFIAKNSSGALSLLKTDANGALVTSQTDSELSTHLDITAATLIKAGSGVFMGLQVIVAGTAAGTANDSATTGAAGAANAIASIPDVVGAVPLPACGIPYTNGLVIEPGAGQTIVAIFK